MDIVKVLASELNIKESQAEATIKLIDEGNTIPFIARYRKEVTGSLDDEILRSLDERLRYLRNLDEKREQVLAAISEQGALTKELEESLKKAMTLVEIDDLYRPYRPKKRTKAMIAREKGLEPLAEMILSGDINENLESLAKSYISEEVENEKIALEGANDIIAEKVSEEATYRTKLRNEIFEKGLIETVAKDEEAKSVYENYYSYEEQIKKILPHRILAINRGEKEKFISVKIVAPETELLEYLYKQIIKNKNSYCEEFLKKAIDDAYKRLIFPAIEREIRNELSEKAQEASIKVFSKNLEQLLLQPPIKGKVVLGWDPGFRTGCKIAVVDEFGKVLDTTVVYPTEPKKQVKETKETIKKLIEKYNVNLISLGNGTASRESEVVIVDLLKELKRDISYVIVNEAGASVYSASELASKEFPNFDVGQRSATSMARRLQDPLAELVKIDPKSIGVGQYQHDMNQKRLSETLGAVVEDSVNKVGVDLNTASFSLLEYISGINKTLAKNIIEYRETNGAFTSRKELLKVPKLGPKAFEQCAGFMRIRDGKEVLDATSVHPESYKVSKEILKKLDLDISELKKGGIKGISKKVVDYDKLAAEIGIGVVSLKDIIKELEKPALDPRDELPAPVLRSDVLDIKDLKEGMILKGTVRNVIDFGAFVDIGIHQDALVHISKLSSKFIKHPLEVLSVGDVLEFKVLSIDLDKNRVGLTRIFE
jgi:hypothetical protein